MMKSLAAALAAGVALSGAAVAQSQTHSDTVYDSISPADLFQIVQGLGYASATQLDDTTFEVATASGFLFWVYALTCDEPSKGGAVTRCYGVEISTNWTVEAKDAAGLAEAANAYTASYSLLKAYVDEDNTLNAQRYGFTSGGVTRAHIEEEIHGFVEAVDYMLDEIEASTTIDFTRPYE